MISDSAKGSVSANAFKRLFLLCLIGIFENGVYGALRLQKVAYFVERETQTKPFEFKHGPYGQYSEDLEDLKEQLISAGYIAAYPRGGSGQGNRYVLTESRLRDRFNILLQSLDEELASKIAAPTVREFGYLQEKELRRRAYAFEEFIDSELNDVLFESNLPDSLETDRLSGDECDELELTLNPTFVSAMSKIVQGLEESDIDWDKVENFVPEF